MTIGAHAVLDHYGSAIEVAKAMIQGTLDATGQQFASEIVDVTTLEAARIFLELREKKVLHILGCITKEFVPKNVSERSLVFMAKTTSDIAEKEVIEILQEARKVYERK